MPKSNKMPYNLEAEQSVLGCILIDQTVQTDIAAELHESDFLVESHKKIITAIKDIAATNKPVDLVTLADLMQKNGTLEDAGGIAYLTELTRTVPSSANYRQYLDIVLRDGVLRRLINSSNAIIEDAMTSIDSQKSLTQAEKLIFDISESNERKGLEKIGGYFQPVLDRFEKLEKDKSFFTGLKTGFTRLDFLTNGLHKGNLVIIAARPSVGKTTFVMNIVENLAMKQDAAVAVFALEMTREELAQRMLCSVANVRMDDALKGKLTEKDPESLKRLWEAQKLLNNAKIYVDESSMVTPTDILSKCRRMKMRYGLDMIVVDHIQLMNSAKKGVESRQQEVTDISRNLKMIAKELDVPVVALSQLSRQSTGRKDGRPILSDLRESGAIEQDADLVIFLHKPDMVEGPKEGQGNKPMETDVIVAKNRNGMIDSFKVLFKGEFVKFVNMTGYEGRPTPPTAEDRRREEADAPRAEESYSSLDESELSSLSSAIPEDDEDVF